MLNSIQTVAITAYFSKGYNLLHFSLIFPKTLKVLWSGGIDTSAVVVALREVLRKYPKGVASQVYVCYCKSSREEYPWFYYNVVMKGPFKTFVIPQHVRDMLSCKL